MKLFSFLLSTIIFSIIPLHQPPTEAQSSLPSPEVLKNESKEIPENGKTYRFQQTNVWAHVDILINDFQSRFQLECESNTPVSGWILHEKNTGRLVSKANLNPTNNFKFEIQHAFNLDYRLTILVNVDREEEPVVISLSTAESDRNGVTASDTAEDFQENSDHPYNSMVKNLYIEATADYFKGDNETAFTILKRARELDSDQPQVESLLKKVELAILAPKSEKISQQTKVILQQGNKEGALALLSDYLAQHPEDIEIQKLKIEIENLNPTPSTTPKTQKNKITLKSKKIKKIEKKLEKAIQENDVESAKKNLLLMKLSAPDDPRLGNWQLQVEALARPNSTDLLSKADKTYNLGLESYRSDDYINAKKFWEETLQIDPNHVQAKRNLERLNQEHPELK